MFYRTKDQDL